MKVREHLELGARYLLARLQEASTWRSLVIIASAATWKQLDSNSQGEVVMQSGLILAGLISAMLPDNYTVGRREN